MVVLAWWWCRQKRVVKIYDWDSGSVAGSYTVSETKCSDGWVALRLPSTFKTIVSAARYVLSSTGQ